MATIFFNSYSIRPGDTFAPWREASMRLSVKLLRKFKEPEDRLLLVTDVASVHRLPHTLYDDVLLTSSNDGVDDSIFWAATKLRGLREIPAPAYSVDWDLFVFDKSLLADARKYPAVGLHYECKVLPPYSIHRPFSGHPINCGIVGFACGYEKQRYCDQVFEFMRNFSGPTRGAMQVAEQAVFGHLFSDVLYQEGTSGYFSDSRCFHIWGNKIFLEEHEDEQTRHVEWCEQMIKKYEL